MRLSPKNRRDLNRIIPFGLIWLIFAIVYVLLEKGLIYDLEFYPSTGIPYEFGRTTLVAVLVATVLGLLMGTIEIRVLSNLFIRRSFGKKILYKTGIYMMLMAVSLVVLSIISNTATTEMSLFEKQPWANTLKFFFSISFWSFQLYMAIMIFVSLFFSAVSDNLGDSVLRNFLIGKYHTPIEEQRIFMFLDMRGSTTLAERMGHVRYFEMLQQYYIDLSDPIMQHCGEVYQYVGDEVIVSWKLKNGIEDNNCLKCFFAMKDRLQDRSEKYHADFGVLPTFKAGIHYGLVTTGEIGVLKKDITFSGDVLNTTARIQGLCSGHEVDILISEELAGILDLRTEFQTRSMGTNELRGRTQTIDLLTVDLV